MSAGQKGQSNPSGDPKDVQEDLSEKKKIHHDVLKEMQIIAIGKSWSPQT